MGVLKLASYWRNFCFLETFSYSYRSLVQPVFFRGSRVFWNFWLRECPSEWIRVLRLSNISVFGHPCTHSPHTDVKAFSMSQFSLNHAPRFLKSDTRSFFCFLALKIWPITWPITVENNLQIKSSRLWNFLPTLNLNDFPKL